MVHITQHFYINVFQDRDSSVRCAVLGNVCSTAAEGLMESEKSRLFSGIASKENLKNSERMTFCRLVLDGVTDSVCIGGLLVCLDSQGPTAVFFSHVHVQLSQFTHV